MVSAEEAFDEYMYQLQEKKEFEQTLGGWDWLSDKDKLLKMIIVHESPDKRYDSPIIHHYERQKLMEFVNTELVKLTVEVIEKRYNMALQDKTDSFSFKPREEAIFDQEYFMFKDVVECIKLKHPKWEEDEYRRQNGKVWLTGVPALFRMSSAYKEKDWPVLIHSMSGLDWLVISGIDKAKHQEFY